MEVFKAKSCNYLYTCNEYSIYEKDRSVHSSSKADSSEVLSLPKCIHGIMIFLMEIARFICQGNLQAYINISGQQICLQTGDR